MLGLCTYTFKHLELNGDFDGNASNVQRNKNKTKIKTKQHLHTNVNPKLIQCVVDSKQSFFLLLRAHIHTVEPRV